MTRFNHPRFIFLLYILKLATIIGIIWHGNLAWADISLPIANLNQSQAENIFETFGANSVYRPLEPPQTFGNIIGVSLGVVAGGTWTSQIEQIIQGASQSPFIPTAYVFFGLQLPFNIAIELGAFPRESFDGFQFGFYGGDIKWTLTKSNSIFGVAVRVMASTSSISYQESISGVSDTIALSSSNFGANISFGRSRFLGFFKPYGGVGILENSSSLSNSGAIQLFESSATTSNSYSAQTMGFWGYFGIQLRILAATVTAEEDYMYGVVTLLAKAAIKF